MPAVIIFIAFVIVFFFYLVASFFLFQRFASDLKNDKLIQNELMILIPNLFLFALVFLAGRFFNLSILLISILASHIGLLFAIIAWSLLGTPKIPYKATGAWAWHSFTLSNRWAAAYINVVGILCFAYPVVIGIYFFRDIPPEQLRLIAIRSTVIFFLANAVLNLPMVINALAAGYIDEDSRSRFLIAQFSSLIPNALFVSMLFWTFDTGDSARQVSFGNMNISFDPLLFAILMAYFLLFLLLPYYIGIQKAKRQKDEIFEQQNNILHELTDMIDLATPGNILSKLQDITKTIENNYLQFKNENEIISTGIVLDGITGTTVLKPNEQVVYKMYSLARPYDKRFAYYDFLDETYRNVEALKNELTDPANGQQFSSIQKKYSDYFKGQKKELGEQNDKKSKSNPVLWIAIAGLLSPFISQALTEIGKWLIEYVKK